VSGPLPSGSVGESGSELVGWLRRLNQKVLAEPEAACVQAVELCRRARARGERALVAGALLCQAEAHQRGGELATAMTLIGQAVEHWAPLSAENMVRAQMLTAFVYNDLGDEPTALQHTMDAALAFDHDVPRALRVRVMCKAADLLQRLGDWDESLLWYTRAEELAIGDPQVHLLVVNNRAYGALLVGRVEEAVRGAEQLSTLSGHYRWPLSAAALDTIARIHLLAGDPVRAEQIARRAVEVALRAVDFQTADAGPYYLVTLAVAEQALGRSQAAWATLEQAEQACSAEGYARVKNEILKEQAEVRAALGDHRGAYELLQAFVRADRELLSYRRESQARIRQALFEVVTARKEAARYREEARRDPLTGLRNRLYARERLGELLVEETPGRGELGIALIDLDNFKSVNDRYSHEAGDRVLEEVADLLEAMTPDDGASFAARFGGEELLLVLVAPARASVRDLVEQVRRAVQDHDWSPITPGRGITFSAGLAFRRHDDSYESLLARADRRLYAAKTLGRNRICSDIDRSFPGSGDAHRPRT